MSRPISKARVRLTSQITASSTTISFTATDSNRSLTSVAMSDFGTYGYLTINPTGKIGNYAIVRFESWSVSGSTITIGTLTWMTFQGNDASGTVVEFPAGTLAVISGNHHWFNNVVRTEDAQTIAGVKTFSSFPVTPSSAPSADYQVANKKYVDDTANAGAADASTGTKGIVEIATLAETKSGSTSGGTTAPLVPTPATVAGAIQDSSWSYAADAQANDSYAITLTPAPTAYATGQRFTFKANTANTGAATLNVNALGAKTIKKFNDQDLETGDIEAGQMVIVEYDGTNFQMQSPSAASVTVGNMTNTEANTLTAGATSNADSLHTHSTSKRLAAWYNTTVAGDAAETNLFSVTLPGGSLGTNKVVNIRIWIYNFDILAASSTDLITFNLKYGGSTIQAFGYENANASNFTGLGGTLEINLMGNGATNSQAYIGQARIGQAAGSFATDLSVWINSTSIGTAAVDSTADQTLAVTIDWEGANATNTITTMGYVELIA